MSFFVQMGYIRYPMLVAALFLAIQVGRAAHSLIVAEGSGESSNLSIHAVLGWGFLSAVLGVLGTVVGLSIAASAIEAAGEVSASLVWGGVKVALSPTIFGLLLLTLSIIAWLVLQFAAARRASAT